MASKKSTFNPKPIDADGDGIVQEGTDFERPVEPEFATEAEFVAAVAEPVVAPTTYRVVDGDSFASIADRFLPAGKTKHEYASELFVKNGALRVGAEIRL